MKRFCTYYEEKPQGDSYYGFHGFMTALLHEAIEFGRKICKDWNNFAIFELWAINNGYSDVLTLDRIDVNGNYCPDNCRWVTRKEQSNNKRNLHMIEYKGETRTLTQWSEILNIPISTLYRYLVSEGSLEKAIIKFQRRKICVVS